MIDNFDGILNMKRTKYNEPSIDLPYISNDYCVISKRNGTELEEEDIRSPPSTTNIIYVCARCS